MKKTIISIFSLSAILLTGCGVDPKYVSFVQCLDQKGATMYGAFWCPHCQNQKEFFKGAFDSDALYVECDPRGRKSNPQLCAEKKVNTFPTWIFEDGSRLAGEITIPVLAEKTQCPNPEIAEE